MRPSGHLHSTTIALAILFNFTHSFTVFEGVLFLTGSMLLDGDFFVSKFVFHITNHRNFITHSVVFYAILIFISYITHFVLLWLFVGAIYHLSFDVFDWGIPLIPFRPNSPVTPHLLQVPPKLDEVYFFKTYFSNSVIKLIELTLVVGFIASLYFLPLEIIVLLVCVEILVLLEFVFQIQNLHLLNKNKSFESNKI